MRCDAEVEQLLTALHLQRNGTAMVALTLIGLGTGLTLTMTEAWQLVLYWGVFVGLGTGALALVFASIVANRWFETRRGLVTGIFSAAYATG